MNKKKCPKCGEENPAEAVMCWACYTPLAGAAPAAAGPAGAAKGAAAPAAGAEGGGKKKIEPWQMGVLGVVVLGGLFAGVRAMMPASSSDDDGGGSPAATSDKKDGDKKDSGSSSSSPAPAPSAATPVVSTGGTTVAVAPAKAPFDILVPPNPKQSVATMAIVPTDGTNSGPQAAALAAYTRRQYTGRTQSWDRFYVYVFSDAQSGQYFADYQIKRKGAPLTDDDFSYLSNLWSSCLARYEYSAASGGRRVERVVYPYKNPNGWWQQPNA